MEGTSVYCGMFRGHRKVCFTQKGQDVKTGLMTLTLCTDRTLVLNSVGHESSSDVQCGELSYKTKGQMCKINQFLNPQHHPLRNLGEPHSKLGCLSVQQILGEVYIAILLSDKKSLQKTYINKKKKKKEIEKRKNWMDQCCHYKQLKVIFHILHGEYTMLKMVSPWLLTKQGISVFKYSRCMLHNIPVCFLNAFIFIKIFKY